MNQRIIELALDAGLLNYVDNETPRRYFIDGHADLEEVEKFAQLIAQECAGICMEMYAKCAGLPGDGALAKDCAHWIKKDFGVEE